MPFDDGQLDFTKPNATQQPKADAPPLPKGSVFAPGPNAGVDALRRAVETTEHEVDALTSSTLERSVAPPIMLVTSAARTVMTSLETAEAALAQSSGEPTMVVPLANRLDAAVAALSAIARKDRLPMHETSLEGVFDLEDELRIRYFGMARANHANTYYDDNLIPLTHAPAATPGASAIAENLKSDGKDSPAKPATRDDLAQQIKGFAHILDAALKDALTLAKSVITEPNQPERPSMLGKAIEVAMSLFMANAASAFTSLIGGALKMAAARSGAEEHLGAQVTEILIDGFKDASKENALNLIKPDAPATPEHASSKPEGGEHETKSEAIDSKLSPKTIYLNAASARTNEAIANCHNRFEANDDILRRVPIDTLRAVAGVFDKNMIDNVTTTYQNLLINEWVNFGKTADDNGVDVRDADKRHRPSKLDGLAPYGVLAITIMLDGSGKPRFEGASIPGLGDAVLAYVRQENTSLASLALHRKVEASTEAQTGFAPGSFDIDPKGKLAADFDAIRGPARTAWARLAGYPLGDTISDGDVYNGMEAALRWLATIPCSQISGGQE